MQRPPPILWSKGYALFCDCRGPETYWKAHTEEIQPPEYFDRYFREAKGLVWIRLGSHVHSSCDLASFAEIVDTLRHQVVLVTTDGDCCVPSDIRPEVVDRITASPYVTKWFTQNYDGTPHNKIVPLPIGLDLHTPRDGMSSAVEIYSYLEACRNSANPCEQRTKSLFIDVHLSANQRHGVERRRLIDLLSDTPNVEFQGSRVGQQAIWQKYAQFSLVASTHGNGLDCHRTWEILALGAIAVTKTSSLDALFAGLPVAIVGNWDECRNRRWMDETTQRFAPLTQAAATRSKLDYPYWTSTMRSHLPASGEFR